MPYSVTFTNGAQITYIARDLDHLWAQIAEYVIAHDTEVIRAVPV